MISEKDVISIGVIRRTHDKTLPAFVFVKRDGLFVPFRSEDLAELRGEEGFVLRSDIQAEAETQLTWQDLVGFTIKDLTPNGEQQTIGEIEVVDESTINTLAILTDGRMLPLHEDFILDIDEEARVMYVNFPFAI